MQMRTKLRNSKRTLSTAALTTVAAMALGCVASGVYAAGGTWTKVTTNPFGSNGLTELLTDGTVLVQYGDWHNWAKLTPDAQGNYATGTWTNLTPSHYGRLYAPSAVLKDGRFFIAGGENISDTDPQDHNTVEIYDPVTNTWTVGPDGPFGDIGDTGHQILADGRMLVSNRFDERVAIFDPTTMAWTQVASKVSGHTGDEESWSLLPDGSVLNTEPNPGERYLPSTNQWVPIATAPFTLEDLGNDEIGPQILLYNGKTYSLGYNQIGLFTAGTGTALGSWSAGPLLPSGQYGGDTEACIEPNGKVLMATGAGFTGSVSWYEYDPTANTMTAITGLGVTPDRSDLIRMLPLPNGQILVTGNYVGTSDSFVYTPVGTPQAAWKPTIASIVRAADGTYTLTGTQLNGLSAGASYGDDAGMDSHYPLVRLVASNGTVSYARTFNHSTMGVATGSTSVSTHFSLPNGLANGTYSVYAVANGIASTASTLTVNRLAAPGGLTATPGNSQITLAWGSVAGATSYNVYRSTISNGEGFAYYASTTTTNYTDTHVSNGTAFYYKIAAVNANGPGAMSVEISAIPSLPCAPAWSSTATYVQGNTASVGTQNYVANFWNQNANPTTHNGPAGSGQPWTATTTCGSAPTCNAAPSAPTGLSASNTTTTSTTLSWFAPTVPANCTLTGYSIYRNGTSIATGITGTTYTVTGLASSTSYTFTVVASDSFGASPQSSSVNVTTSTPPTCTTLPSTPTGVAASNLTSASVTVNWNAVTPPANCTLVNYYVAVNGGRSLGTNPNTPSYTFSSLTPSTTYTFSVWSADEAGQSNAAATITVTTPSAGGLCTGVAAWNPNSVSYAVGALVTYQGNEYKCLQAHTSQAGWDPVDVPALWSKVGAC